MYFDRDRFWEAEEGAGRAGAPGPPPDLDLETVAQPDRSLRRRQLLDSLNLTLAWLGELEADTLPRSPAGDAHRQKMLRQLSASLAQHAQAYSTLVREAGQ